LYPGINSTDLIILQVIYVFSHNRAALAVLAITLLCYIFEEDETGNGVSRVTSSVTSLVMLFILSTMLSC